MSDERIKRLAEWMGWKAYDLHEGRAWTTKQMWWVDSDGYYIEPVKGWNPLTRIQDAWMLLQAVRSKVIFSKRQQFFELLTSEISNEYPYSIAWPDALMFLEPKHICAAVEKLMEVKGGKTTSP